MKKKFLLTMSGLVCALCFTLGLAACNKDEETKKNHTAEQWAAAFADAQSSTQDYTFSDGVVVGEIATTAETLEVHRNAGNVTYLLQEYPDAKTVKQTFLMKKGERYYEGDYKTTQNYSTWAITELDTDGFTEKEKTIAGIDVSSVLLKELKTHYEDFKQTGVGGATITDGANTVTRHSTTYSMENFTFTVGGKAYTAKIVEVQLDDESCKIDNLEVIIPMENDATKSTRLTYSAFGYNTLDYIVLPEFAGKTFALDSASVDKEAYNGILRLYEDNTVNSDLVNIVDYNLGKNVTCNANGTFTSEIVMAQSVFDSQVICMMLRDFKYTDDHGAINITNKDVISKPEELVTLTGKILFDEKDGTHKLVLDMTLTLDEEEVTVTYIFRYSSSN